MSKPIVVQTCGMPEKIVQKYADEGRIELRLWKPADGESAISASDEWIMQNVRGAAALLCIPSNKVGAAVMDAAGPSLKVVSTMSVGYEHIDCEAAKERGVKIGHTPDVLSSAVADIGLVLALAVMRHVLDGVYTVKRGEWLHNQWTPLSFCGPALEGRTVGFVGFGSIAQALVKKLVPFAPKRILYRTSAPRPFDMSDRYFRYLADDDVLRCYYQSRGRLPVPVENEPDLTAFASECDVILSSAYLVNIGRGGLVDTPALVDALQKGEIAGAGLDVLEGEPRIPADHPLMARELQDKVLVLPHIASATYEARVAMAEYTALNALGALHLRNDGPPDAMPAELK